VIQRLLLAALTALALVSTASPASAQHKRAAKPAATPATTATENYAQRFATLCAACHGADGRSVTPGTPMLAGQHSFYAITQLFLYREGRRSNEAMTAVAKTMTDNDLRGFADFIATLPPLAPTAPATPSDVARMCKGQALALQHKCVFCHGADFAGGQQVPRLNGQLQDYLQMTLRGFRSGARVGYSAAMPEAVGQIANEDLDTLAYYIARFTGTAAQSTCK
jgi:cytochrome c553